MSARTREGAVDGDFRGDEVQTYGGSAHLLVETSVGIVVDQDVNDWAILHGKVIYWLWERGDKGNQETHEIGFFSEAVRLEVTHCHDRLKVAL